MMMNIYIFTFISFLWLLIISIVVFKLKKHYNNLITATKKEKLNEILDILIETDKKQEKEIELLKKNLAGLVVQSQFHIQKIGLVRFNPFERMGGEQSFVVALMDNQDTGITLNFIYTKEGLRVYTKRIKKGKGEEYELSEEEKKAIVKAKENIIN